MIEHSNSGDGVEGKKMTIEESLQIDDMHINEFLRQAYREAAMYELEQYAKEVEKKSVERGEDDG